jgi:hypothetical protein
MISFYKPNLHQFMDKILPSKLPSGLPFLPDSSFCIQVSHTTLTHLSKHKFDNLFTKVLRIYKLSIWILFFFTLPCQDMKILSKFGQSLKSFTINRKSYPLESAISTMWIPSVLCIVTSQSSHRSFKIVFIPKLDTIKRFGNFVNSTTLFINPSGPSLPTRTSSTGLARPLPPPPSSP